MRIYIEVDTVKLSALTASIEAPNYLQEEFARGDQISQKIVDGNSDPDWDSLLEPCPFFLQYKNYLQVPPSPFPSSAHTLISPHSCPTADIVPSLPSVYSH